MTGAAAAVPAPDRQPTRWLALLATGLLAGLLSGLFGVGGGIIMVPMLTGLVGLARRRASGTSLAAIVPTALVGVMSYALHGEVDWVVAGLLCVGSVVGAQVGAWLLHRLPVRAVRWGFIAFLLVVAAMLFVTVPSRDAALDLTLLRGLGLVALGLVTGVLSGVLGIGGGVVIVPVLVLVFGMGDVVAKGTSLAMMIPTAVAGTVGNLRRDNVDLRGAAVAGLAACLTTSVGAWLAMHLDPKTASVVFACFLLVLIVRMTVEALRAGDRD